MILLLWSVLLVSADSLNQALQTSFVEAGGSKKAFQHLSCFLKNHAHKTFDLKTPSQLQSRCEFVESGESQISVNNANWAVIVDYTVPSHQRRFHLLDLSGSQNLQLVRSYYVSHGRNGNTHRGNRKPGTNKNTIEWLRYYGNEIDSNATSTGFFITGAKYHGMWSGPSNDKFSLVLHGIEKDLNDNACQRAVVVHGNSSVNESGARRGVHVMSSGCFMLDYNHVNSVIEKIQGSGDSENATTSRGGIIFFTYGPREVELPEDYYCNSVW